ncbi:MAG: hypothetical protein V4568_03430 [Pseudomonadota bacterium]
MDKFPDTPSNVHHLIPRTAFRTRVTWIKSALKDLTSTARNAANEPSFETASNKVIRLYPANHINDLTSKSPSDPKTTN